MEKKRSVGVTIFAILEFLPTFGFTSIKYFNFNNPVAQSIPNFPIIMYTYLALISIFSPICGIGLLLLKEWGRKIEIIKYIFTYLGFWLIITLGAIFTNTSIIRVFKIAWGRFLLLTIVLMIPVFFFTRPKVKEQFKQIQY